VGTTNKAKNHVTGETQKYMFQYRGNKNGKHQVFETEDGVKLDFRGPDAHKFVQVNMPKHVRKVVRFDLTANQFLNHIYTSPNEQRLGSAQRSVESAVRWEVELCGEGHTVVLLIDRRGEVFAEAHIGDDVDVDRLVLALLGGGCLCTVERLAGLLEKTQNALASANATRSACA
jgi:hypothetical protein